MPGKKDPTPPHGTDSSHHPPKRSMANCLGKRILGRGEGNTQIFKGYWQCLNWNDLPLPRSCPLPEAALCKDLSTGKYESQATSPQLRTPQKGHLSFRGPHEAGIDLHHDYHNPSPLFPVQCSSSSFPRIHCAKFPTCSSPSQNLPASPTWDDKLTSAS